MSLKILSVSILINIVIVYLFVLFVERPLNDAARQLAIVMCKNLNQECKFPNK